MAAQRGWGWAGRAPRSDAPPAEPEVEHVYGRVSADSDEEGSTPAVRARAGRVSAPAAAGASSGDGRAGSGTASPALPPAPAPASGPLPQLPSLLDDGGPLQGSTSAPRACDLDHQGSAESFSMLAAEERPPSSASCAAGLNAAAAAGLITAACDPAPGLTEEQRAFGETLAAEAAADAARARRGGAGPSGRGGSDSGSGSDSDHARERRELVIYAFPMQRDKIAFLPVINFCQAPPPERRPSHSGGSGGGVVDFVRERIAKATEEAAEVWENLKAAEDGTLKNRLYKLGQRMLDSVPAEERLMRSLPRKIDAVVIYHPTQLGSDALRAQMQTMSTSYGIKAVGKAAAATVLLPLAIGVDLIILPGPQVLTYYTSWQLWRNAKGANGAWGRAAFVTQSGGAADIRVTYVPDPRLDRAYEGTLASRDGVLPEEDITALIASLKEPSLEEPLRELRRQRLRKTGRAAADAGGRYAPLPADDDAPGGRGTGDGGGGTAGGGGAAAAAAAGDSGTGSAARSGSGGWAAWRS